MKKSKTKQSKIIEGIGSLSLFFSFAPQPEQIRTMIEKAMSKQEKAQSRSKSSLKNETKGGVIDNKQQLNQDSNVNIATTG